MRVLLIASRLFVGLLFIISGLVKANDPLGLSYKMEEYFEVWNLHFLNDFSLASALVMNVFEILAGIAVLIGWRMKLVGWLLLLLILFFTFLTGYAAFSGKIAACGCFGDCIPLKPIQSFWKDIILLILILFLLVNHRLIRPLVHSRLAIMILLISTILVSVLQWYVLRYLPIVDCLPYKEGNNILQKMQMPAGAVADEYSYTFKYKKDGKIFEFAEDSIPADLDDSYEFIDRGEKLVRKGNDLKPAIVDFSLTTLAGIDTTQELFQQTGKYVLLFTRSILLDKPQRYNQDIWQQLQSNGIPFYIVTADPAAAQKHFGSKYSILRSDGTVIKTAGRTNPTYLVMQKADIVAKYSYAEAGKVMKHFKW